MITVVAVRADSRGDSQEFNVVLERIPDGFHSEYSITGSAPLADLPPDIRAALRDWLGES
jgi:hypothetical protein